MKFETFLSFWMAHNEAIIQWMLVIIVGFSTLLFFRAIFGKKESSSGDTVATGSSMDGIQDLLKKIIDQTTGLEKSMIMNAVPSQASGAIDPATMPAGAPSGSSAPGLDPAELLRLKTMIQARDEELTRLKADPIAEKLKMQIEKVQELEGRLKEYEILEDDIADLSLYKEENARLKAELQKLAGGAAPQPDELVDQFADAVDQTKVLEGAEAPAAAGAPLPNTNDPMADFAQVVQMGKSAEAAQAAPEPAPAAAPEPAAAAPQAQPVPAPVPAAPAAPAASAAPVAAATPAAAPAALAVAPPPPPEPASDEPEATANLFAEFSGSLDTDRVMEELVSLEKLQGEGKDALEESLDPEKMVAEAAGFSKN